MADKLRDYQLAAAAHLHAHPRAGLFLDMGLGKTATTLTALTPDHLPALVVAPKRVAEQVWEVEARRWRPDLRVAVLKGSPTRRRDLLRAPADVYVLGRDNLSTAFEYAAPYRTVILDELSGFKTRNTTRWKLADKLLNQLAGIRARSGAEKLAKWRSTSAPYVFGLTGTPSPKSLMDLWAQVYLLDKGERLGPVFTTFQYRYFIPGRKLPNGIVTKWELRPGAADRIMELIEDICLSMDTEGRVDLPPQTFNEVEVPLPTKVRELYRTMKKDLVVNLDILGSSQAYTAVHAGSLTNRLSQVSAGFLYPDKDDPTGVTTELHTEKIKALQEIVEGTGGPVLAFYLYTHERDAAKAALGDLAATTDDKDWYERWNNREIPVLLAHPASIGHGLNLQPGGHTIVWLSLTWDLEQWEQGNKRLHRSGQENPVVVHMLMSPHTVDHAKRARLLERKSVQDALMDHLQSPI